MILIFTHLIQNVFNGYNCSDTYTIVDDSENNNNLKVTVTENTEYKICKKCNGKISLFSKKYDVVYGRSTDHEYDKNLILTVNTFKSPNDNKMQLIILQQECKSVKDYINNYFDFDFLKNTYDFKTVQIFNRDSIIHKTSNHTFSAQINVVQCFIRYFKYSCLGYTIKNELPTNITLIDTNAGNGPNFYVGPCLVSLISSDILKAFKEMFDKYKLLDRAKINLLINFNGRKCFDLYKDYDLIAEHITTARSNFTCISMSNL